MRSSDGFLKDFFVGFSKSVKSCWQRLTSSSVLNKLNYETTGKIPSSISVNTEQDIVQAAFFFYYLLQIIDFCILQVMGLPEVLLVVTL